MKNLYSTTAHATGDGRNGHVSSDDGIIDLDVRTPVELGGNGGATNPEQLFAAGYAACFHSALRLVAQSAGVNTADSAVSATVHLGQTDAGGFGIGVELDVSLPHATPEQAREVVEQAHQVCPYSNATRNNIDVGLSVV
ncbi:MAG: organic hydroperoxide resistance protein [Acidimicrobiaceae bacterium]|nr:organic hydroperoxide resistance protein [Acidimicrobiaceae bacterium]